MAHSCPDCGSSCFCRGDSDSVDYGDWDGCECDCEDGDMWEEDSDYAYETELE